MGKGQLQHYPHVAKRRRTSLTKMSRGFDFDVLDLDEFFLSSDDWVDNIATDKEFMDFHDNGNGDDDTPIPDDSASVASVDLVTNMLEANEEALDKLIELKNSTCVVS